MAGDKKAALAARDDALYRYLCAMQEREGRFPTVREIADALSLSSTSLAAAALERLEQRGLLEREGRRRRLAGSAGSIAVPILGTIAAGEPIMAAEQIEGWLRIAPEEARGRSLFALRIRGESMINAGILPGDTVLLEQTASVDDGAIAAVWLEDAATLKRVYREPGGIRLQPENDEMEPIFAPSCEILGRLIGLVRSYE